MYFYLPNDVLYTTLYCVLIGSLEIVNTTQCILNYDKNIIFNRNVFEMEIGRRHT